MGDRMGEALPNAGPSVPTYQIHAWRQRDTIVRVRGWSESGLEFGLFQRACATRASRVSGCTTKRWKKRRRARALSQGER